MERENNIKKMIELCMQMISLYNDYFSPIRVINKMIWEKKLNFWKEKLKNKVWE